VTLPNITALIDGGGQIMIGTMKPITTNTAVAHDGRKTLAMLRRRAGESVDELLSRLDTAIATAKATGARVDEINTGSGSVRYEI
jgi:ribosomal protein L12E/L44/L45/RPP1/RPP2